MGHQEAISHPTSSGLRRERAVGTKSDFREIAFIDCGVDESDILLSGLRPEVEAVPLSGLEPAVAQMVRTLDGRENIEAIHVVAHGRPGEVSFAAGALSRETIGEIDGLSRFGAALGTEGSVFLWSCQTGAGESGAAFIDALARQTGARVAAASGLVGAEALDGTWTLDRGAGPGRSPLTPEAKAAFTGVLVTFTGTTGNDRADAATGTLTGFSGGTVAQLQDTSGDVFNGGNGADIIVAGGGDDTINIANGQFVAGESINGGGNTLLGTRDQIVLTSSGTTVNFSAGTVTDIETLTGSSGNDTVTMTASQWTGFSTINLGSGSSDILNVLASGDISALGTPTLTGVETGNLTGTSGDDSITLTGAQLNAILIGSGTINLGTGTGDTLNLTSTSTDLNTLGATNNSIQGVEAISFASASFGVTLTLSGQTEAFTITGSGQADTITGGSGADTINAGDGDDTINIANGQFVAGETINGGGNTLLGTRDQIVLTSSGTTANFSTGTVTDIETLTGSSGNDTVTTTASQWTGFSTINLGSGSSDVLNVLASGDISALGTPTLTGVETGNLTGTSNNDSIALTGAQLNAILIGSGTVNLGAGTGDTLNLTSTSTDLNTLGATNNSIQGVEVISAATATAGVTLTLSGQTEAFTITGSGQADTITGGSGADTIDAGDGDDTINVANGQFVAGETINGGANSASGTRDQIVLTSSGTTANFSTGTVTGIETLTGSSGNDTVTLTASQLAALSTINLGAGTSDVLNVIVSGDISSLVMPTLNGIEAGNLVGTSGNDLVTLSGAQLDAIVVGSGTINLGAGTGDTLNLTSTSSDLNTLGATDASIQGVEAISFAGAAAGVTLNLSGQTEAFTITGSNQADTITAGSGAGTINAGDGDDTINIANGQFVAGETINGGANSASGTRDQIVLTSSGTTANFSTGTVTGIETLTGSSGNDTVTMTASQLAALSTIDLGGGASDVLNVIVSGDISALGSPALTGIEAGNLVGTSGNDLVTLSGAQLDAIVVGSGAINLGAGTGDTLNLTSTSSDLNTLGATDASIQGVEAISFAGAAAGVTLNLSGQTEAFTITGSGQADTITGGSGAGTINAGDGDDTINIANGQFVAGETINGGANSASGTRDQIVLTSSGGTTVDFSVGTVTGIETLTGSSGNDTVTMTASQLAALSTIDLGGGASDVLNVIVSGDISALGSPALTGIEAGNLVGTSGNDLVTLSGAQLDAIVVGSGAISLGAGTGDTLNLTSTSSVFNALGATDVSIQGVEAISAAGASAGVTLNLGGQTESFSLTGSSQADSITGGSAADAMIGGGGADLLSGGLGDDTLVGGAGNDIVDGGGGTDTAVFGGARADYLVSVSGTTYTLIDNRGGSPDGTDTVTNVENFQFSDGTLSASQLVPPPPTTPPNKIALENMKQGNPKSEWGIIGDGGGTIQGFATEISTNVGGTVDFKIATDSADYRIDIYRLGYYGGDGARKVGTVDVNLASAQVQPHPIVDMSRGLIDCGNWAVSASWAIPQDAVSGVYIAKLVREDGTEDAAHIPFIVRDDSSTSDIVFQTSDTTWQAYNAWGGASLYYGEVPTDPADMIGYLPPNCGCGLTAIGRATAVSYNRPIITNTSPIGGTHDFIFGAEHSAIRWLEQNGYDVSYISGIDTTRSGSLLLNHNAFLSVGHDEYWSTEQRANVEAARDAGTNLAFWGGNSMYWKVRWETSIDGNGTPYRTLVSYKETWGGTPDPTDISTGTWRDPRFAEPGQEPENSLIGTMYTVDTYREDIITIPYDYSNLRFWRNTDVAELQPGETYSLVKNLLGYEWDSDVENGYRPAGLIDMSLSTVSVQQYLRDYGTTVGPADVTHSLTMYRAESGALVFGAGTVFWSWGLDAEHEGAATPTDPNVRQAMVNMFADMGIQPGTLDASLVLATMSTDTVKPTATITSPTLGASFAEGQKVTITGTAQDSGGGIIAGVEISTDGGQTWWKATGRENWSYSWNVQASGTYTIVARAVDDSVNLGTPTAGVQVTVNLPTTSSLWTLATKPAVETELDRDGVELGVRFQATTDGVVEGIRFYKGFYNIGPHDVSLWTSTGQLLATGVSTGESISGWQTVTFSSPIRINPGETYVASYHTNGYYSSTQNYFTSPQTSGVLNATGGSYAYSANSGTFPGNNSSWNYWVDVVFAPDPNLAPVATDDTGLTIGRNGMLPISFSSLLANDNDQNNEPLTIVAVGNATNATVTLDQQTGNVIFTPNANYSGPASFTYTVSDGRGGTDTANVAVTVEQDPAGVSLFGWTEGPAGSVFTGASVELGMKFSASKNGTITGIRYYKPANDNGTHTGSLWSSTGTLLATVTFTNESTSGWQTATFSNPIEITKDTTYVASYHSNGAYYADSGYFTTSRTNGPLTGLSSAASGGNGVYRYSSSTAFPDATYQSANYWVDVVYKPPAADAAPVAGDDNLSTPFNAALSVQAGILLANDTDTDGDPLTITGVGDAVNGTVTFDNQANVVTFTPTSGYSGPASFTYTVSDGQGGTDTAQVSVTVSPQDEQNLFATATPTIITVNDSSQVELGMKFQADVAGWITGFRFYKGPQNTGPHEARLWTSTGELMGSATFTNETASGWQTVTLAQPIEVQANTTYVVSYHSNGFYSATSGFFGSEFSNGDLTGLANGLSGGNGVYAYGPSGLFPTSSYNATNYYVDVAFRPQLAA